MVLDSMPWPHMLVFVWHWEFYCLITALGVDFRAMATNAIFSWYRGFCLNDWATMRFGLCMALGVDFMPGPGKVLVDIGIGS